VSAIIPSLSVIESAPTEIDWTAAGEEAVTLLRQYLRIRTPNDPEALSAETRETEPWRAGTEASAAQWLAALLKAEGIEVELLEGAPGRVNLIARLRGLSRVGITLLSHSDVVPAKEENWSHDPFGAETADGFMYGRGALDLKGLGILHLMTLFLLARQRVQLQRDVVLLIVADEETGGKYGAEWLLAQRPELAATALVLGEGAYSVSGMASQGRAIHAVAVGEKGYLELELVARSPGGHASMPSSDNAPRRLIRALDRVLATRRPIKLTPLTRVLLQKLGQMAQGLHALLLRRPWLAVRLAARSLTRSPLITAMLQDSIAVTVLHAGEKSNVLPAEARAILSIRLLPGTDEALLTRTIAAAAADPQVSIRTRMRKPANLSPGDTPAFQLIEREILRADPQSIVIPILSPAASDCRFWRAKNVPAYGWIPFVIPVADLHRVHGVDERVPLESFKQSLRVFYEAVRGLTTSEA
jgi:acetylornithine deacetylase/succinyl-diaminopimelate desuccinylase-like protein